MHAYYSAIVLACLSAFAWAHQEQKDIHSALVLAVQWMQQAAQDSPVQIIGVMTESKHRVMQEQATMLLSGWAATQISLARNKRLKTLLNKDGESPVAALLERIAAATYQAWSERRPEESVQELRTRIASLLEDGDTITEPQERLSPESLRKAQQEIAQWDNSSSALEHWSATQEASQYLDALAARAGLSPREVEILTLQRQGLTQEQIGAQLHLPRTTVKTHAGRARDKMRKVAEQ